MSGHKFNPFCFMWCCVHSTTHVGFTLKNERKKPSNWVALSHWALHVKFLHTSWNEVIHECLATLAFYKWYWVWISHVEKEIVTWPRPRNQTLLVANIGWNFINFLMGLMKRNFRSHIMWLIILGCGTAQKLSWLLFLPCKAGLSTFVTVN
jgi:hypothetical protein